MKKLSFDIICKQLKGNHNFEGIADDLNALLGAVILLLGVKNISGDISIFLNALMVKDQLINIGKRILNKIVSEKTIDCDKKMEQMQWAYSMIYYTAFFDVLDEQLPEQIRNTIKLSVDEKKYIYQIANWGEGAKEDLLTDAEIIFPNIVYGYTKVKEDLNKLYESMSKGLSQFVHMLSFGETGNEQDIRVFDNIVSSLPSLAIKRFQRQYCYLASQFNEFYIYMQIKQDNLINLQIEDRYKKIISVVCDTDSKIDVGLEHLEKMMLDLPERIEEEKVKDIANILMETYKKEIERSIIESKSRDEKLVYPSICKAFIPQTYKMLEYTGKEKLEKKETWEKLEEHNNMDSFWAKYCMAQQGMENLLLILGEPGGGKSLLTKIFCARMIDENNLFVRVPLRDVSVEKEIEDIVCDQIKKDGDVCEPSFTFKWFAKHLKSNPITIVFDGYDEVLQATGRVYRGLLKKILRFQQECMDRHRPVRVVVTSRETLIDKADIPVDTLVMKLLEFNEEQKAKWIAIWNQSNADIFRSEHINYFMLPRNDKNVSELSRQPLLLLMLAIYDANLEEGRNALGQEENLNRTKLYNELLGRFIRRELRKGPRGEETAYDELPEKEREAMVNFEMERLGIAALGMFTNGQLSLTVDEMNKCLAYMEAQRSIYKDSGRMLTNAEGLFGSFFFIHYSKSKDAEEGDKNTAFEFLHKTFYEFLVADLVLKYLVRAMDGLDEIKNSVRGDDCRYLRGKEHQLCFGRVGGGCDRFVDILQTDEIGNNSLCSNVL